MNNCKTCKYSRAAPKQKTNAQRWEEDPRPVAKWWQAFWDPSKYKSYHPCEDDFLGSWNESIDKSILYNNEHKLICQRFPNHVFTYDMLTCGEYNNDCLSVD